MPELGAAPAIALEPSSLAPSNPTAAPAPGAAAELGVPVLPGGLPGAQQLAALANAFFRGERPPQPAFGPLSPAVPPLAPAPTTAFAAPGALPVSAPALPHTAAAPGAFAPPGVPGLPFAVEATSTPLASAPAPQAAERAAAAPQSEFYFLEFARRAPAPVQPPPAAPDAGARARPVAPALGVRPFDAASIARDFPILQQQVNGRPLVWLDSAATTQKPQVVIDRLVQFYSRENSNVHRGAHTLAARSTDAYEGARERVRRFLHAPAAQDIVFVRGATEAINLVAQSWGRRNVHAGDEILITHLEHHSNIVPWQQLCTERGARLRVAPIDDRGQVIVEEFERLCGPRTRLVAFAHVSNALGTVLPVRALIEIAQRHGARVLVDGAQAVSHLAVDVQALGCDFYVFSGHKVFGPTGIGALYGRSELLESMPPWQGGGSMIADVTFERSVYHPAPARFEAGTGNIADAAGLAAALEYLEQIGLENVSRHEHDLLVYGTERLLEIPRLRLIGTAAEKAAVLSFVIGGIPSEEIGTALAREGIAVRAGHHCAQPALRRFGLESSVRPSLALYNTRADLDALAEALARLQRLG